MYPSLQVGPLSLPTAQFLALVAAWFGLSVMAQVGRRLQLDPDLLWNLGTIALGVGVIVARLSHAVQFWGVYRTEPLLLVSIRPGGLLLWPGASAALAAAYLYLMWKGVDPRRVSAAAVFSLLAGGAALEVSNFLTGAAVGVAGSFMDSGQWLVSPLGFTARHPVALYRALGMMLIVGGFLLWGAWREPGRLAGQTILAYALLRLFVDGFAADARLLGSMRLSQVAALVAALGLTLLLARTDGRKKPG